MNDQAVIALCLPFSTDCHQGALETCFAIYYEKFNSITCLLFYKGWHVCVVCHGSTWVGDKGVGIC